MTTLENKNFKKRIIFALRNKNMRLAIKKATTILKAALVAAERWATGRSGAKISAAMSSITSITTSKIRR
jgi:hypothetical protein